MRTFKYLSVILLILTLSASINAEVIEEIYAVADSEIVTKTEFTNAMRMRISELNNQSDNQVFALTKEQKTEILDMMIENKLLISKAKQRKYDVSKDVIKWIEEIKKQQGITTDQELSAALRQQGQTMEQLKEFAKTQYLRQYLIQDEISRNINVDNSEIMAHFKKHKDKYMTPLTIELNCIYLKKDENLQGLLDYKKDEITKELKSGKFIEVAKKHSQLSTDPETNFYLGKYKSGELDKRLEGAAIKLSKDKYSDWIETDNGWYIIQLIEKSDPKYIEYKKVSGKIRNEIFMQKSEVEFKKYMKKLRTTSHVKIFVKF